MSNKKSKTITLDEVLNKFNKENKKFINKLKVEEKSETVETVDLVNNERKSLESVNEIKKNKFINEIKSGLGDKIKNNKSKFTKIKKPLVTRVLDNMKKIFLKF